MAKRGKFEKIGKNEAYYETHETSGQNKKNSTGFLKKVANKLTNEKGELLNLNPKTVPEKAPETSKFTFEKNRRSVIYTKKEIPEAGRPDFAPFVLMLCVFVLQFLATLLLLKTELSATKMQVLKSAMFVGVYIIPCIVYIISAKNRKKLYGVRPFSPSYLPFTFTMLALLLSVTALQKYYIAYAFTYSTSTGANGANIWLVLLSSAVMPAICEEIFVRGIFQHEVSRYGGGITGIAVSSILFAMLHFELEYFIIYLISGIILGSLTHITGSCIPAIVVHLINNVASVFLTDRVTSVAQEQIGGTLFMIILALLSFAFLIIVLRMSQNISENRAMAAEGIRERKDRESDELLISREGRTPTRLLKCLINPFFLVSVAIFIIAIVAFSALGA